MSTQVESTPVEVTDGDDFDGYAHYADRDEIMRAHVEGVPIKALCGKVWVPNRDPQGMEVCPTCMEIIVRHRSRFQN